jgi:hypothetical protein
LSPIEALEVKQTLDDTLNDGADYTESLSMPATNLADHWPDALAPAAPADLAAVVVRVGVQPGDHGAHDLG